MNLFGFMPPLPGCGVPESLEALSVLKCLTDDPMLREYFLRSVSGLIAGLPDVPTAENIAGAVAKLVELFRALEARPRAHRCRGCGVSCS